ncbi:MAG: short-chain dehydrogenase, partial [Candidatus Parabeggiatoa sp. nov. 1]
TWLVSLRQGQDDWQQLLHSLGSLYVRGAPIDWLGFDHDYPRQRVELPTYPFQRQRYWIDTILQSDTKTALLPKTSIFNLLQSGNTELLTQQLKQVEPFSEEELKHLPRFLEILAKQYQLQVTADSIKDWLYQIEWQYKPRPSADIAEIHSVGSWLIFADQGGVGQALAESLEQRGQHCILVYADNIPANASNLTAWLINSMLPADFERLFNQLKISELGISNLIHLWSLDAALSEELSLPALEQAQHLSCGSVLHLVQTLSQHKQSVLPRLWLVTRGAVPIGQHPLSIAQSPLWGLGKVVALEYPEFWGGLLDMSPDATEDEALMLLAEIQDSQGEDQIAFRDGQRYVARLVPKKTTEVKTSEVRLTEHYTYLITGGLGALGLRLAQWMVAQGVRYLVLTGRSGASTIQAQETLKQLELAGAQVRVAKADVANQEDMVRVFADIETDMPPLRGIIHAAGVLDDGVLQQQNWERFRQVMAPKVAGSWHLHTLTQEQPLDFFVCFSSMASLLGVLGQGNYAAANAFMDALAHYRQAQGFPALSINWGAWAGTGMAANIESHGRFADWGIKTLPPDRAIGALEYLLGTHSVQTTVAQVDWNLFKSRYEAPKSRLLEKIVVPSLLEQPSKSDILQRLEAASDCQTILVTYMQDKVAKLLRLPPSQSPSTDQGFFDMGMDSLMAVELKNQLNASLDVTLPTTLIIEYPTIDALTAYLLDEVLSLNKTKKSDGRQKDSIELSNVQQLSDDESAAFIDKELADLLGESR